MSVRTRFEVFKRDDFQCQYCGRRSPEVVLELDHIVPICEGGTDDPINLRTSCWDCNRGKGGVPLDHLVTGEDPHDKAIELLERERQLREYNVVLADSRRRRQRDLKLAIKTWCGIAKWYCTVTTFPRREKYWLNNMLLYAPVELVIKAMEVAAAHHATDNLAYVNACLRNWKDQGLHPCQPTDFSTHGSDIPQKSRP